MELNLYIDGKLIPRELISSIQIANMVIWVELIYSDKKERLYTDSTIRKIELKI